MKSKLINTELKTEIRTAPLVFEKKKNKSIIKTLKYRESDTGKTRFFAPGAQEWYNSIYTYNKNYIKSLPVLDKSLGILLKNYCNMWPKQKTFKKKPRLLQKLMRKLKLKSRKQWLLKRKNTIKPMKFYKRLSPKKVFVGKGNLKHTSNKVIVTLYTYNNQKVRLFKCIRWLVQAFFLTKIPLTRIISYHKDKIVNDGITKYITVKLPQKKADQKHKDYRHRKFITIVKKDEAKRVKVLLFNRRLTLDEYLNSSYRFLKFFWPNPYERIPNWPTKKNILLKKVLPLNLIKKAGRISKIKDPAILLTTSYSNLLSYAILKVNIVTAQLKKYLKYYKYLTKLVEKKILNDNEKLLIFISKANKFNIYKYRNTPRFVLTKFKEKKIYLASLLRFAWLLYINDVKFKHPVLVSRLKYLVMNLYDKEVQFNIIELKKMHLNSDIYTQAVSLKLKNRKNKLYRVLKRSLSKVNLPNVSRLTERHSEFNRDEYIVNKIRNTYIKSMFDNKSSKIDSLNNLLFDLFPLASKLSREVKKMYYTFKYPVTLQKYVLFNTKNAKLAGVRVEAKGRLTRRFTAQRSVFKMRYKGGLKNVDSSFKGLSASMVRGFLKTNVEYSIVHGKNRNGAYGVKGWVGSKEHS